MKNVDLAKELDRELVPEYRLVVEASDGSRVARAMAVVGVSDVNDETPHFVRFPRRGLNVSELSRVGAVLATFKAEDGDAGDAGRLRYAIKSGNLGRTFQIETHHWTPHPRQTPRLRNHACLHPHHHCL